MAQLIWTKNDEGYISAGLNGMYGATRTNGKFQFMLDGDEVGSPGTYAACKEAAQAHEDERAERSRKAQAEAEFAYTATHANDRSIPGDEFISTATPHVQERVSKATAGLTVAPAETVAELTRFVQQMDKAVAGLGTWTCKFCKQSFAAPASPRPLCPYCKHDRGLTFAAGTPTFSTAGTPAPKPAAVVKAFTGKPASEKAVLWAKANNSTGIPECAPEESVVRQEFIKPGGLAAALAKASPSPAGKPPHVLVKARAGTGKTTTIIEGLKAMRGEGSSITPSPQQAAIWCELAKSCNARSVGLAAFSRTIADELRHRVPSWCDAMTMHSMGFKAIRKQFNILSGDAGVNKWRTANHMAELLAMDPREMRKEKAALCSVVEQLVGLCKVNLTGTAWLSDPAAHSDEWTDAIDELASRYDVDLSGEDGDLDQSEIFDLVPRLLHRAMDVARDQYIDYNDMLWVTIVLKLPVFKYDLLLVDEVQDLNRAQLELAFRAGDRLVMVGDDRQAIFAFAGADHESYQNIEQRLKASPRGCKVLPLTMTRRCGKAIVAEARKLVGDFEAHESCCLGKISTAKYPGKRKSSNHWLGDTTIDWSASYAKDCKPGDMVLCRVNAPLVSQCFAFLKRSIKAVILGRDVGDGLLKLIEKMKAKSVPDLTAKLTDWLSKEQAAENAKLYPSENRLIMLNDKVDCIMCFTEDSPTVDDVVRRIASIFTDNRNVPGIRLSSIHKAKGLEARRVFLLEPEGCTVPHPMAKTPRQYEQELNLRYVAQTRSIEELIYVS